MKKIALIFSLLFMTAILFSCKSSHKCAAYSNANQLKVNTPS